MVFVYEERRQIVRNAVRLYAERFPERVTPSRSAFTHVIKSFQETGRVDNKIRRTVTQNPHASTRQLARESGISQRSVLRILHLNKFHAFHVSLHQELHGNDFQNRVNFYEWGLQKLQSDYIAAEVFNEGYFAISKIMDVLEIRIGLHCKQYAYDAARVKSQDRRSFSSSKEARTAQREARASQQQFHEDGNRRAPVWSWYR
ncbi:hypothetical protein WN55_07346 [Dufourea novaeangliae]|uniref:DUF4817 domain-containing protein n=1 Tax=Dufourea novaeangliae TaxID=178035 RepID=A0A154P2W7_DUFNO|nr:hypothetical protein WN55_07346 [Dufourea novaeangliae]